MPENDSSVGKDNEPQLVPLEALGSIPELLKGMPAQKQQAILNEMRVVVTQNVAFSGPLPPPWMAEEYEKLHPGFLTDLMDRAREAQTHEQEMDKRHLDAEIEIGRSQVSAFFRGQWFGFIFLIAMVTGAVVCAFLHEPVPSAAFVAGAAVAGRFMKNPFAKEDKAKATPPKPAVPSKQSKTKTPRKTA